MDHTPSSPLSKRQRTYLFLGLVILFIVALPFLYLYATGYRFDPWTDSSLVSTGGIYVSADRTGAEIYIDDELVRETRIFRRAFYAQGLEPGIHRVSVQKKGSHTWVKELPVYPHVVTEAIAFNMPLVPQIRVISAFKTENGVSVLTASTTFAASTTNPVILKKNVPRSALLDDTEYATDQRLFTATTTQTKARSFGDILSGTEATTTATTTKEINGVRLFEKEGDVYAQWVGAPGDMPYYYCAPPAPTAKKSGNVAHAATVDEVPFGTDAPQVTDCDPTIAIDRKGEHVTSFDFFPGSTDMVVVARTSGIYVTGVDNRGWQNTQPLLLGKRLDVRISSGNIYAYDGVNIYQILTTN